MTINSPDAAADTIKLVSEEEKEIFKHSPKSPKTLKLVVEHAESE